MNGYMGWALSNAAGQTQGAWEWDWSAPEALAAVGAFLVAVVAVFFSWRANRLVGVYKRALWTVTAAAAPQPREDYHGWTTGVRLSNIGESPARDVVLTLAADPLHMWSDSASIPLIGAKDSEVVGFVLPLSRSFTGSEEMAWDAFFRWNGGASRDATIEWTDLEGRRRRSDVRLPARWTADG